MRLNDFNLLKNFFQIDLVKVFSLTAISTTVKMLTAFVSVKIIASILGPSGIALIGQFNNFSTMVMAIASIGINQGVTKYISTNKTNKVEIKKYVNTAFKMTVFFSILCGLSLIGLNEYLATKILHSKEYSYVFTMFGICISFYTLNNLLLSIVNGFQEYKKFVKINIINSMIGLVFTIILVYFWELKGALISLISYQTTMFFITYWILRKKYWIIFLDFKSKVDSVTVKKYSHYTLMTITTAVTIPLSQLYIRSHVITNISILEAGYWESMNKISAMYLMMITSSLSVYFLPKLAGLKSNRDLKIEIFKVYKIIMPFLFIGLILIYLGRFHIIKILFTKDFSPMSKLFLYQLIGDFFKIGSWLLAFNMVAKSMTKVFITTEIFSTLLYVISSLYLVKLYGVIGITKAYMINYVVYFVIMIVIFRKIIFYSNKT